MRRCITSIHLHTFFPLTHTHAAVSQKEMDSLPIMGLDESVVDIYNHHDEAEEDPEKPETEEEKGDDLPSFPGPQRVSTEEDLIGQPAYIGFNSSLASLVNFLQLPLAKCFYRDDQPGSGCVPCHRIRSQSGKGAVQPLLSG